MKDKTGKNSKLMIWVLELDSYHFRYKLHISKALKVDWKLTLSQENKMFLHPGPVYMYF